MANEFIIKNGFYSNGNSAVTGSLIVSASVTGNDLQVGTNKLVVSASGDVGIGITTPTASLHLFRTVDTNILIIERGSGFNAPIRYKNTIGSMYAGLNSSANFAIGSSPDLTNTSNTFLTVSSSGNVGIGTLTPSAKLHINNTGAVNSLLVEDETNPDVTPFVIDSAGNTGIGTTPSAKLHVSGNTIFGIGNDTSNYATTIICSNDATNPKGLFVTRNTNAQGLHIHNADGSQVTIDAIGGATKPLVIRNRMAESLIFGTNDTERMRITSAGSIGIGTIAPISTASLHIKPPAPSTSGQSAIVIEANAGAGINLISDNYNTNQSVVTFGRQQSSMAAFLAYGVNATRSIDMSYQSSQDAFANKPTVLELGSGFFALKYNSTSSVRTYGTNVSMSTSLYMDSIGRMGIGTTTPQAILHVSSSGYNEQYPLIVGFNQLVVSASGTVGIGTTTPSTRLHVRSTAVPSSGEEIARFDVSDNTTSYLRIYNSTTTDASFAPTLEGKNSGTEVALGIIGNGTTDTGNTAITIFDSRIGSAQAATRPLFQWNNYGTTQMSMRADGNLGIGITNPTEKLVISGNMNLTSSTTTTLNIQSGAGVRTYLAADGQGASFGSLSNHDVVFYRNNSEIFRRTATGLGINTSTPNAPLDVNGNTIITGSLTVTNNFTVLGSSSIQYITSSQLNISDNIITVNTITPSVRFGGLSVIDSGSSPQQSGSMLFDSQNNQWIFVHQSAVGAAVTSSILIMGPQTFNNVGNETTLTANRLTKAVSGDLGEHISDSNITDTGTLVSINSNTEVTGSLTVTNNITGSGLLINGSASINGGLKITSPLTSYNTHTINSFNFDINQNSLATGNVFRVGLWDAGAGVNVAVIDAGAYTLSTINPDTSGTSLTSIDWKNRRLVDSDAASNVVLDWNTTKTVKVSGSLLVTGSANINGDTAITGSLTVTGNLGGTGGSIDMNALIQASLLYLSNNF